MFSFHYILHEVLMVFFFCCGGRELFRANGLVYFVLSSMVLFVTMDFYTV